MRKCYIDNHLCKFDEEDMPCVDCNYSDIVLKSKLEEKKYNKYEIIANKEQTHEEHFINVDDFI